MNVFASEQLESYWFQSGTPSYVVKLIQNRQWRLKDVENYAIKASRLSSEGIMTTDPVPVLYQTGYLTIKAYDRMFDQYILGYPNKEVAEGFIDFLLPMYLGSDALRSEFDIREFVLDVLHGRPEQFMQRFKSLLSGIPHLGAIPNYEVDFQNAIYILFRLVGFYATMEEHTSDGRIDLTVRTPDYVYLFEFKIDSTAAQAIAQIHRKEYWQKFAASGKTIYLIGANFSTATHTLDEFLVETPAY